MKHTIYKNSNGVAVIEVALAIPVCIVMIISMVISIFSYREWSMIWILIIPGLLLIYFLDLFLWQIKGYEEIEFDESFFIKYRRGRLFNQVFKIKTSSIISISMQEYDPDYFSFFNMFRMSKIFEGIGGRILLKYGSKGINITEFGLGLTRQQALQYVQEMNEILQNAKNSES